MIFKIVFCSGREGQGQEYLFNCPQKLTGLKDLYHARKLFDRDIPYTHFPNTINAVFSNPTIVLSEEEASGYSFFMEKNTIEVKVTKNLIFLDHFVSIAYGTQEGELFMYYTINEQAFFDAWVSDGSPIKWTD